jgi:hypothetical protein
MNNLSYLNHLMSVTDLVKAGPGGSQGGFFDADADTQTPVEDTHPVNYPNPFDVNSPQQLNLLEGELGDSIEYLLPNPSLRYKLAYLRVTEKLHQLTTLNTWITAWPLPDSLKTRLQAKRAHLLKKQAVIESHMQQDATVRFGWLSKLGNLLKQEKLLSQPLDPTTAAHLLWQLAETSEEKAQIYTQMGILTESP